MSALAATQAAMHDWLRHADPTIAPQVEGPLVGDRLRIHADAYRLRLIEVLGNDFPVTANRGAVDLGPTEFRLLDYLMQHPGRVFSREQLLDTVWGSDVYVEARTVDVHVGRLRKALRQTGGDDPIRTVRSAGYALRED